jgi:hypothetical protein
VNLESQNLLARKNAQATIEKQMEHTQYRETLKQPSGLR